MSITQNIFSLIPQRPPFVMIDELLYSDDKITRTCFRVRENNVLVSNGQLLEAGLVENIAQTAAARAGHAAQLENQPVVVGYIGSVNNLQVFFLPKVLDELETEITVVNQVFNVTIITGEIRCKGETMAQCEMKIFINKQNKTKS